MDPIDPPDTIKVLKFPFCAEELIKIYGRLQLNEISKEDWLEVFAEYRANADCVKLMTFVAKKLNFWGGRNDQDTIADSCPREHLNMIMSPDNKTDWTRAVWLIYAELHLDAEGMRFGRHILELMDHRLFFAQHNSSRHSRQSSPHPEERQNKRRKQEYMHESLQHCLEVIFEQAHSISTLFLNYIKQLESLGIKSWEDFADTTDEMPLFADTPAIRDKIRILRVACKDEAFKATVHATLNDDTKDPYEKADIVSAEMDKMGRQIRTAARVPPATPPQLADTPSPFNSMRALLCLL